MDDETYIALVQEVQDVVDAHSDAMTEGTRESHRYGLWNEPGVSIADLLASDAKGILILPDQTVARLWEIGYALGYEQDFLLNDYVLAKARPERRRLPDPPQTPLVGGGHGAGRGTPGKREWPARWDADTAIQHVMNVATEPDGAVRQPDGTFRAWGIRDGVDLRVVVTGDGDIETAYPVSGEGVVDNPLDDVRRPLVARIRALIDQAAPEMDVRAALEELVDVGEWDQALLQLRALGQEDPELSRLAGL